MVHFTIQILSPVRNSGENPHVMQEILVHEDALGDFLRVCNKCCMCIRIQGTTPAESSLKLQQEGV